LAFPLPQSERIENDWEWVWNDRLWLTGVLAEEKCYRVKCSITCTLNGENVVLEPRDPEMESSRDLYLKKDTDGKWRFMWLTAGEAAV